MRRGSAKLVGRGSGIAEKGSQRESESRQNVGCSTERLPSVGCATRGSAVLGRNTLCTDETPFRPAPFPGYSGASPYQLSGASPYRPLPRQTIFELLREGCFLQIPADKD
jgi:hypothetical protein